jgi:hypothetical protein
MTMNDAQPNEDVATLKLKLELEKLERQWLEERSTYLVRGRVMSFPMAIGGAVFGIVIGIVAFCIGVSCLDSDPELSARMMVIATVAVGAGGVSGWYYGRKAQAYNEAKAYYDERRQQLLRQIAASKEMANTREDNDALPNCNISQ